MINCIIIEDEPLAQNGLVNMIKSHEGLNLVAVFDEVGEYLEFREEEKETRVDLMFLDVELPGINGISFLRTMAPDFPVVLTTAYNEFAIEGYELNILDYLLKPIARDRFAKTIQKAEDYFSFRKEKNDGKTGSFFIRSDKSLENILFSELVMVEAMRNYVIYQCDNRRLISYNSLKNAEKELDEDQFVKVQKSFIVNKNKIQKIEKGTVHIHNKKISISRENRSEIIRKLTEK
jgi:DNA-binding LytR/AlgR family response regulator